MSLLFDALQRSQNNDAQKRNSQATLLADNEVLAKQDDTSAILSQSATNRSSAHILPYAAAIVSLLTAVAIGAFYLRNQIVTTTNSTTDVLAAVSNIQPVSALQLAASSSISEAEMAKLLALPGTASGPDSSIKQDKTGVLPTVPAKHAKHKTQRKSLITVIQASNSADPLRDGYLALSEGRLDQAEKSYLTALVEHPHEKDALLGLAVIAQRKRQTTRATDLYRQVLREDMGNAAAAAGLVSLSVLADPVAAESQLRELLDIKPAAAELHYALGSVLARQLRWGEAQQSFFRAYSLTPDNTLYAYNLAVSLDRLHQPAAALPYYEKAAHQTKPSDKTLDMSAINRRIEELNTVATESR